MADDKPDINSFVLLDGTIVRFDGTVLDPAQQRSKMIAGLKSGEVKPSAKATIADIPIDLKAVNAMTAIVVYQLIGMSNADIAFLLDVNIPQIEAIVKSNEHVLMKDFLVERIYEIEKDEARAILAQHAPLAAAKMVSTIQENGALGYMAAKDVLSMQKIYQEKTDNSLKTLEIVIMSKEDLDKRSVDGITVKIGG